MGQVSSGLLTSTANFFYFFSFWVLGLERCSLRLGTLFSLLYHSVHLLNHGPETYYYILFSGFLSLSLSPVRGTGTDRTGTGTDKGRDREQGQGRDRVGGTGTGLGTGGTEIPSLLQFLDFSSGFLLSFSLVALLSSLPPLFSNPPFYPSYSYFALFAFAFAFICLICF